MPDELLISDALRSEEWEPHFASWNGPTKHADLVKLPRRAMAAFKVRAAKRIEVIVRLPAKLEEAIAAGLEVPVWTLDSNITADTLAPAVADITKLLQLHLGKPSELGEPIRWNDPRLGPLWPDGPPAWHVEAEKLLRELENTIADLPAPDRAPLAPSVKAQLATIRWLDKQLNLGVLDKYSGEYVLAANEQILAHGTYLGKVRKAAEKKAKALQIPTEVIAVYFVFGE